MPRPLPWTVEQDAALLGMLARGLSYEQVARRVGKTRNAVIARTHRLNKRSFVSPRALRARHLRWRIKRTEKWLRAWREELADLEQVQ